ncbi:hypothetical protein FRC17_010822 [Serendipita sp. 399]|nr:hypothetical protein FRC17_010822 [Serendipita sp. 399]
MTHVPFTSRLASLIGLPSTPSPSPKYDGTDDYYIPYTGTFEPPPTSSAGHGRTHVHTLSGSTKAAPSSYSVTTNQPHPYNPDRYTYFPSQGTATTATFAEEPDRGRQRKPRPVSTSSSFAALSPSSEHLHVFPSTTTTTTTTPRPVLTINPPSNVRKTAPSYLALDGGFIGQSPVATVPPREKDAPRGDKPEKSGYRSSFASFMTFGNSRKSVSTASGPLSAQATTFPHGASKLRGEARHDSSDDETSYMQPIMPAFMRQRSQSYVDETEQTQELRRRKGSVAEDPKVREERFHSVRVMMPTSFFDTSPFEERNDPYRRPIRHEEQVQPQAPIEQPHPYRQHAYRKSIEAPSMINLGSPVSPSFEFLHPYASAPGLSHSSPSKLNQQQQQQPQQQQHKTISLHQPTLPKSTPDSPLRSRPPQGAFPFINPFAEPSQHRPSPPPSRPVTPKGRLRALASGGLKTLKGSISTPNLRAIARLQQADPSSIDPLDDTWRHRNRRETEMEVESVEGPRGESKSLGRRKGSAPDLRRHRRPALQEMRRLTAAEVALQEGAAAEKEREEWADAARRSFQNQRSRSLSRSRTKSIAKASNAAIIAATAAGVAAEEKERERARRHAAVGGGPSSVAHTAPNGSAPPTASSSGGGGGGPATAGDEGRPRTGESRPRGMSLKGGMDTLAQRAFSQGHVAVVSGASSASHSRHHSGETLKEKNKDQNGHRHRRSESWGRSAVKRARSVCVDPDSVSPAVERVLFSDPHGKPDLEGPRENDVLNITSPTRPETPVGGDDMEMTSSAVGIAIGTPPLDTLVDGTARRIEHPYGSVVGSPTRPTVGPHPTSPVLSALPTQLSMSNLESRHRLPPRPVAAVSPPRSPHLSPKLKGLDAFVPTIASAQHQTLSRESWLVYMNAMEETPEPRPFTAAEKGKGRAVTIEEPVHEEYEQQLPEDVEAHMDAHDSHLDPNSDVPPLDMMQNRAPSAQESEPHLTRAFRHSTVSSEDDDDLDDEHANMTFQAEKFPPAESSPVGSEFRPKSDGSDPMSASLESSWRKSVVSSEGAPHSQESSPKASPRALVNLDDLDGYSDLFYQAGPGSSGSRPRSGSSFKTVNSGGVTEKNRRSDIITFGPKGGNGNSSLEQSLSSPESGWPSLAVPGNSTGIGLQTYPAIPGLNDYGDSSRDRIGHDANDPYLLRTWDPEEEDDNYRIVNTRPALLPRPVNPIHRHSTKLSVIEGSVDDHATASESTPDPTEAQSIRAISPTRTSTSDPRASVQLSNTLPVILDPFGIPVYARRNRTSSERAVVSEGMLRTSMVTNVSDQSRMSGLSDFPIPPMGTSFAHAPANPMAAYVPQRPLSPTPVSPLSAEPPSPAVEFVEDDELSISDHHHGLSAANRNASSRSGSFRANRATFGPDAEITRQWAAQEHPPSTPTTEEH